MVKKSSKTDRYQESKETLDSSFRDIDYALTNFKTGVETSVLKEGINEQLGMLYSVKNLYEKYNSLQKNIRGAEGNGNTKKQLKHQLKENIETLERIWNNLGGDKKSLKNHDAPITIKKNAHIYSDLSEYRRTLGELVTFYEHYEQASQTVSLGGTTSNIHAIIDSEQDAKAARKYEKSDAKQQQGINAILHDTALTSLRNDDMERYEEYLELVVNGQVDPCSHPFYLAHQQSFNLIKNSNPSLYTTLVPQGAGRTQYIYVTEPTETGRGSSRSSRILTGQGEAFPSRIGRAFGELMSNIPAIERDPRKKQAWQQVGAWAAVAGGVFMGYKMLKNLFSKKETNPNKWGKAAGWGAALLALTNGDRIGKGLIDFVQDISGRHPAEKIQVTSELFKRYGFSDKEALAQADMYIGAPVATISALHFIPIYELSAQNIVEYKNNEFKFNYDNYEKYINTYNWTREQKDTVLNNAKKLKDDDSLNMGFASWNIHNQDDLKGLAQGDKSKTLAECKQVQDGWDECVEGIQSGVNQELFNQGLRTKDTEAAKKVVKEYNEHGGDGNINASDLRNLIAKRMEEGLLKMDENSEYGVNKHLSSQGLKLKNQESAKQIIVEYNRAGGEDIPRKDTINNLIIKWMRDGLLKINEDVGYNLDDMLRDPNVDLYNKTMKGFTNNGGTEIKFNSFKELFDIVYLTEQIKKNFKGRPSAKGNILDIIRTGHRTDEQPFHIAIGGRVEFNDHNFRQVWKNGAGFYGDTDVVKAFTLQKLSDTLKGNKQFYVDYLNKWRETDGKFGRM